MPAPVGGTAVVLGPVVFWITPPVQVGVAAVQEPPLPVMVKPPLTQFCKTIPLPPPLVLTLVKDAFGVPVSRLMPTPFVLVTETSETVNAPKFNPESAVPPVLLRLKPRSVLPLASVRLLAL